MAARRLGRGRRNGGEVIAAQVSHRHRTWRPDRARLRERLACGAAGGFRPGFKPMWARASSSRARRARAGPRALSAQGRPQPLLLRHGRDPSP